MEFEQFFWCLLTFITLLILLIQQQKRVKQKRLPPSPRKLPFLGNLHQLVGHDLPHVSLQKLSKEYGPLMLLKLGSIPTLVISSADIAREIFKAHDLVFSSRPRLYTPIRLSYECNDMAFAPYGEYWRDARKIAIIELLSIKRVHSFQSVRTEEVEFLIDSIANSVIPAINLSMLTLSLANNVVCRVAFGRKYDGSSEVGMGNGNGNGKGKFYEILRETQSLLGEMNVADFYPWLGWVLNKVNGLDSRLEKTFKELDQFYDQVIEEHLDKKTRRTSNHEDFVDVLLQLQKDPNQTISLTNNQVKGILTDMFIAGSDTSSATLVWAMSELIKNPSTLRKAQDEVREIAKGKQRVEEIDLPKLTYLKLVLKETLRLHPPAPLLVPRETTEPCTIRGYEIPAKTRVFINAKAISTDPNVWEIGPNMFMPERFLDCDIDYKGQDFELIPFGAGRRGCPGLNFAVFLIELALANLLYRFDWSLPHGMTRDDVDMEEAIGLTTHKKNPLLLCATPS